MRLLPWIVAALAVAFCLAPVRAQQAPQPNFRSAIDVVSLNVTVTDPSGRFVTDLPEDAFTVYEDGMPQEITFFNRSNLPIALSILLDTSASMEDKLQTAQEAAVGFVKRLRPQDLGQVIDFDSRVLISQSFTSNVPDLEDAIRKTTAGGSTSLHNAIYISLKELKKIQARSADEVRRQAIVVLSDGEDTSSLVSFDEVLELAKRSETAIYAIGLRGKGPDHLRGSFNEADFVLRAARAADRRPRVLRAHRERAGRHLRADLRRALEPVHDRLLVAQSQARRRLAADRRARQRSRTPPRAPSRATTDRRADLR